jgi:hypothetical protein
MAREDVAVENGLDMASEHEEWTEQQIIEQFNQSTPLMKAVQRLLAANHDRWVTASELAEATGTTRQAIAGVMGAYSSHVYRRWGRNTWPFHVKRYSPRDQTLYNMPKHIAEIVAALDR